jgi:transposase
MSKRTKKFYSREFKVEAVKLVTVHGYKPSDAAQRLGVSLSAISKWKRELEAEGTPESAFPGKGYLKPADAELKNLRNELEKVKRERDILKKAVAYFAEPLR